MQATSLPAAKPYHPTTFRERGVAVPFTTPLLGGTRARLAGRGLELVVHNPSGGRGVYVTPWTGITSFCRPTLYDKVLNTRLAFLEIVTPRTVREIARSTAAEGLAGEAAKAASEIASAEEEQGQRSANRRLLAALVNQVNMVRGAASEIDLDAKATQTITWLAPRLGQQVAWVFSAVNALAGIVRHIGMDPDDQAGKISHLLALVRETKDEIEGWVRTQRTGERVACARMICSGAGVTLSLATGSRDVARVLADDMVGLLRLWATDPDTVSGIVERPEWILDGWEQIGLIWRYARDDAGRRAALAEIAEYVPVLPREVNEWSGYRSSLNEVFMEHRSITLNEDWRTGAVVFDLIVRNEQLRALAP